MRLEDIYYQDKRVVLFDAPATSSRSAHWKRESSAPHRLLLSPFSSSAKWIREQLSGEHCNEHVKKLSSISLFTFVKKNTLNLKCHRLQFSTVKRFLLKVYM
jgi:hypothetical protein